MKSLSMKTQILILTLALVTISLAFLIVLTVSQINDQLYEDAEHRAISMISILAANVGPGIEFADSAYIKDIVIGVFDDEDVIGVCICGENDKEIYYYNRTDQLDSIEVFCPPTDTVIVNYINDMIIVSMGIKYKGIFIGDIWMALTTKSIESRVRSSIIYLIGFSALVLLVVFFAGNIIATKIVTPIKIFENAAKRIQNGDMVSAINILPLNKDFVPLGDAFNKMSTGLDNAFEELKASRQNLEAQVEIRTFELQKELTVRKKAEDQKRLRLERVQNQKVAISRLLSDESVNSGNFESATRTILEIVARALNVERVSVWMFNDDNSQLICKDLFEASRNEHSQGTVLKMSDFPKYFEAIGKERTIACHNAQTDPRTSEFTESYLIPLGITSILDTSFLVSGKLLGVICAEYTGVERMWEDDEITFIDEISGQISQVYSNAGRRQAEEQKNKLKEELERAQRMESLGILAGGVAHDLNNTLGPLVGYPELILMKLPEDSPLRSHVERIGRSAKDAADVIQDLLTLARRGRYEMEPTNLVEVIEAYLDSPGFRKLSTDRPEIKLNCDYKDKFSFINGSAPHLSKVIMNLIINAMDAISDSGKINISVTCETLDRLHGGYDKVKFGDYVVLRVRDTGSGIDAEDMDKIFEPYYSKKKMGSSGSGLGLSVVYGIVKDHHGYYDIFSTKGEGAEFVLYFPCVGEPEEITKEVEKIIGGQESILIVDDTPEQRDIAMEFLTKLGYTTVAVENGHKAIEYLSGNIVDLVLLDMIMEKNFDGLDTYREIIKLHPGQKAIIISGFSASERVNEMFSLGAGAYVKKPFTFSVLSKAVRSELDRKVTAETPAT